ncbi:MAG: non-heme iron oxygenase ferredoxin subunit [Dehalococcoidia bacterium]|nr:non-heme iron oxygenase ferredoxin subunit [Dehalococcoidia bacterium]
MPDFVKVAKLADIPPGEVRGADLNGQRICLANVGGHVYAIGNECTHQGGPMEDGFLEGTLLMCPWHAGDFDVTTGKAVTSPASGEVPSYRVRVTGDDIEVQPLA